jgi:hypothetical protein
VALVRADVTTCLTGGAGESAVDADVDGDGDGDVDIDIAVAAEAPPTRPVARASHAVAPGRGRDRMVAHTSGAGPRRRSPRARPGIALVR